MFLRIPEEIWMEELRNVYMMDDFTARLLSDPDSPETWRTQRDWLTGCEKDIMKIPYHSIVYIK